MKDTVVDDVILKQIESLIDISLIGSEIRAPHLLWCLYPRSLEDKVPVLQRRRTVEGVVGDVIVGVERSKFSRADHVLVPALKWHVLRSSSGEKRLFTFLYTGS